MMSNASDQGTFGRVGTFNVNVYDSANAICGQVANASISRKYYKKSCHKSKYPVYNNEKGLINPLEDDKISDKLKGPDQLLSNIPAKIYQKLVAQLSVGQSDCVSLASHIFPTIRQDDIEYLVRRYPRSRAKGVFKKMSEKGITLGQMVEALRSIERLDVIETLIEEGYPKDPFIIEHDDFDMEKSVFEEEVEEDEEEFLMSDETKEEDPTQENICFKKNSYRLIIVEEPTIGLDKETSSAPKQEKVLKASHPRLVSGVMQNLITRVCFAQFQPTSPEENYTQVVSIIEDIPERH